MPDDPASPQAARAVRVHLEVDLDAQPIRGTLETPDRAPTPFIGWLGLTAALDGLKPGIETSQEEKS